MYQFSLATAPAQSIKCKGSKMVLVPRTAPPNNLSVIHHCIMALQYSNGNKPWVLVQWDKGDKTKMFPEISARLKPEQNKPSQQKHSIFKKKRKKSDYSNKVISLPSAGRTIQHKLNCSELKIDPQNPCKSFTWGFWQQELIVYLLLLFLLSPSRQTLPQASEWDQPVGECQWQGTDDKPSVCKQLPHHPHSSSL